MSDSNGAPNAAAEFLPLVYEELRRLAAVQMARECDGHTLDATALVHEAFLRLGGEQRFDHRGHFFAAAAEAMRRILVDHARKKAAGKRDGGRQVPLDEAHRITESAEGLIALNDALDDFAGHSSDRAQLVKLRFFAGMTMPEAAAALNISLATAERWWLYSRSWLYAALSDEK